MRVLALDPGFRQMGFALGETNNLITWGTWRTSALDGGHADRLRIQAERVYDIVRKYCVEKVVIETYRVYRSVKAQHTTIELIGALREGIRLLFPGVIFEEVAYKTWAARAKKIISRGYLDKLANSERWKAALKDGSVHSRDAVMILLSQVLDLGKLQRFGGGKDGG